MKMIRSTPKMYLLSLALGLAIATGCRKESSSTTEPQVDTSTAKDVSENESAGSETENIADQGMSLKTEGHHESGETVENVIGNCATVTKDTVNKIVTIDFGTTNCLCKDGRYRRGQIIVTYTSGYFDIGSVHSISFNNFYVNDNHVEGTRSVTNNGFNIAGNMNWTINANNMKVTRPDGTFHQWNSVRNREMIAGYGTATCWDDVYLITGNFNGSDSNGISFSANITNPLRREVGCHWIVSGTIEILKSGKPPKTLDFGTGTCDDQATVTVNGHQKTITLH